MTDFQNVDRLLFDYAKTLGGYFFFKVTNTYSHIAALY